MQEEAKQEPPPAQLVPANSTEEAAVLGMTQRTFRMISSEPSPEERDFWARPGTCVLAALPSLLRSRPLPCP